MSSGGISSRTYGRGRRGLVFLMFLYLVLRYGEWSDPGGSRIIPTSLDSEMSGSTVLMISGEEDEEISFGGLFRTVLGTECVYS